MKTNRKGEPWTPKIDDECADGCARDCWHDQNPKTVKAAKHTPGPKIVPDQERLMLAKIEAQKDLLREMLDVLKKISAKITDGGYRSVQITGELGIYLDKAEIDELRAVIAKAEVR